jgi:hypothetical protein
MGIRIDYTPVGPTIAAAYATGVGNAQDRRRREALAYQAQQDRLRFQAAYATQQHAWDLERDENRFTQQQTLQERMIAARGDQAAMDRAFDLEKQQQTLEFQERWRTEGADQRAQLQREHDSYAGLRAGTHEWTPDQWKRRQDIQDQLNRINETGTMMSPDGPVPLDPKARAEAIQKLEEEHRRILPTPKGPQPSLGDRFSQDTYQDPATGDRYQNVNGEWKLVDGSQKQAQQQARTAYQDIAKIMAEGKVVIGEDGKPTIEEISFEKAKEEYEKRLQVLGGGGAATPPVASPPAAGGAAPPAGARILNPEDTQNIWSANAKLPPAAGVLRPATQPPPRTPEEFLEQDIQARQREQQARPSPPIVNAPSPRAAELAQQYLPQISNPAEAKKLGSGALFIDDTGTIRVVP